MKTFSTITLAALLLFGSGAQAEEPSTAAPAGSPGGSMGGMQHGAGQGMQQGQGMQHGQGMQGMRQQMQEMHKGMNMQGQPKPDCPNGADCPAMQQMPGHGSTTPAK